jgi:hypothetical protein
VVVELNSGSSGRWIRKSRSFEGILVLSVEGVSGLSERCILKGCDANAFKCSLLEMFTEYVNTIPYGSVINAEYWGDGQKIVEKELDDLLHFRTTKSLRK